MIWICKECKTVYYYAVAMPLLFCPYCHDREKLEEDNKMRQRYPSNIFNYCDGEPKWDIQPAIIERVSKSGEIEKMLSGGTCKLDFKTCGKMKTFSGIYTSSSLPLDHSYSHKVIPKEKKEEPKDNKSKVTTKNSQGQLF